MLTLRIFKPDLAICRLPPDSPVPAWIGDEKFVSYTRTPDELSIVCHETLVPGEVKAERNWRMLGIIGPLDFSMTGVLASLAGPLSDAGIAIFVISTYDTDYLLVKEDCFDRALEILEAFCVIENPEEA